MHSSTSLHSDVPSFTIFSGVNVDDPTDIPVRKLHLDFFDIVHIMVKLTQLELLCFLFPVTAYEHAFGFVQIQC